jgi:hypothetical protein
LTYGEIAKRLKSAPRAVGQACGRNPYPVVVPCHRVVAADGGLGGFASARGGYCSTPSAGCWPRAGALKEKVGLPTTADQALLDAFADTLWLEAGLSKNTLASYRADLAQFSVWLGPAQQTLEQVEPVDIHDYLRDFSRRAKSTSQRRLIASLRRFYRHLLADRRNQGRPDPEHRAAAAPRALPQDAVRGSGRSPARRARHATPRSACATAPCWKCSTPPACASPNWWR